MDKEVVKELIQNDLTVENITLELNNILFNIQKQSQLKTDYANLKTLLSKGGNASENAASIIYNFIKTN